MSITQNNIGDFITFLYRKRKNQDPPLQLISGWKALSQDELNAQLSGLFQSWGLSEEDKRTEINLFFKETLFKPKPVNPPPVVVRPYEQPPTAIARVTKRRKRWPLILSLFAGAIALYFGYQYIAYLNTGYVYTITDNVSVRNEAKEIVARMDLSGPGDTPTPSFQKLKAVDRKIYARSIDNSDKTYPCRKVLVKDVSFFNYLFNREKISGYVNTNYVVDNDKEFNLYLSAFKEVKNSKAENASLTAVYRKIIIGSMSRDAELQDKYIALNTGNVARASVSNTYGIIKQTIKANVQYVIIAGLSDGNYYRFEGDVRSNEFRDPVRVMQVNQDGSSAELAGAYRFMNHDGNIALYDCKNGILTNYEAAKDDEGKINRFEYREPTIIEQFTEPDTMLQDSSR